MKRAFFAFVFCTLLSACAANASSPSAIPTATIIPTTAVPSPTFEIENTAVPIRPQDCGYQWAHGDLPELSNNFQQSIQALQPEATAGAYAFGENCVRADGTVADFLAMETDFNISLHVDDLANESVLGKWIVQVMQVVEDIPSDQIAGPRPGHVSIVFQSSTAQAVINFYIDQYQELPSSL